MANLKNSGSLSQLSQATAELDALGTEVKLSLHHLEKPFVKLQSLALHGEGSGLTPEQVGKLNKYVENPFEAFANEHAGLPLLKEITQKTTRLMSEGKLQLKPEKTRKAQQLISGILNNSLESLHQKSKTASLRRRQLSESVEVAQTERELAKLREQLEALETRKKVVEGEHVVVERAISETTERIRNHKSEIEKNVLSFTSRKIRID